MSMRIIVFEDWGWQRLLPLVYVRATFQLLCGMDDLFAKIRRVVSARQSESHASATAFSLEAWCRNGLATVIAEQTGVATNQPACEGSLLLNGRGLWSKLPRTEPGQGAWVGIVGEKQEVACIYVNDTLSSALTPTVLLDEARTRAALAGLPRRDVSECVQLFDWPWQLVHANADALMTDWKNQILDHRAAWDLGRLQDDNRPNHERHDALRIRGKVDHGSYLLGSESIYVGEQTRIKPCVVIDAENGPVWIGRKVTIQPHCYVQGPAYIGDGTLLQPGAVVREGTTIGPGCKIGGEIEASIIQGFSNKQHDGFLGHSYLGSWINIAADCINSDLKNTYGTIRVPINGREVETGKMFVGMLVGDFSKAGINVSFPTGAVIGFCSSIFAPRSPKFVPSFAWIDGDSVERYDEQRGLALANKVMARRQKSMTSQEREVFMSVRQQALAIEHSPQRHLELANAVGGRNGCAASVN